MKKLYPYLVILVILFSATACGNLVGVNSNSFEFRYPVVRCKGNVQVNDPEPLAVIGQKIDPARGIWLLTPDVTVTPPKFNSRQDDQRYISQVGDFIGLRVENLFLQNEWIAGVQTFKLDSSAEGSRKKILSELAAEATKTGTIDYNDWKSPNTLRQADIPGYSLFVVLEGQIGLNKSEGKDNTLFLYLIDNAEGKVTYSDMMMYDCDIRNPDGLEKVMDHAYLKLLNVRFPEILSTAK